MGKEKAQKIETRENERLFFYEILGIILLILAMLAIGKMGFIGLYLMLILKLLFGDWYFMIIILMIVFAIRSIIIHKKLKITNIRYLGIIIFLLALILLSHFSMHKYIKDYDQNYLKLTLSLYFNSFKNQTPDLIIGGGIIGAILFYLSYYLLSEVGVIFVSIILLFLGIVFITKLTIKDFFLRIYSFFRNSYKFFKDTILKFRETIDKYDKSYVKTKVKFKISKVNNDVNYKKELEYASRNVETIKKVLNSMNVFYNDISYVVARNVTTYFINSHYSFSYEAFRRNLKNYFMNFTLKKDEVNKELLVEINNITPTPLRIYELEEVSTSNIIFGIDDRNEFLNLNDMNNKIFIFDKNEQYANSLIDSIIVSIMHYKVNLDYYYIDLRANSLFKTSINTDELDLIISKMNDRIEKYNNQNISSIIEYNKKNDLKDKYQLIIINGIDKIFNDDRMYDKLNYMIDISQNYGYYFVFSASYNNDKYLNLINLFDYKLFFDNESNYAKKSLNFENINLLNKEVECFLSYKSIIIRASVLKLTNDEEKSIRNNR